MIALFSYIFCPFDSNDLSVILLFSGETNGAVALLQKELGTPLVYLACRKHVYEVAIGGVFEEVMGVSKGPEPTLFLKFRQAWIKLDPADFEIGVHDKEIQRKIQDVIPEVTEFLRNQLEVG